MEDKVMAKTMTKYQLDHFKKPCQDDMMSHAC